MPVSFALWTIELQPRNTNSEKWLKNRAKEQQLDAEVLKLDPELKNLNVKFLNNNFCKESRNPFPTNYFGRVPLYTDVICVLLLDLYSTPRCMKNIWYVSAQAFRSSRSSKFCDRHSRNFGLCVKLQDHHLVPVNYIHEYGDISFVLLESQKAPETNFGLNSKVFSWRKTPWRG